MVLLVTTRSLVTEARQRRCGAGSSIGDTLLFTGTSGVDAVSLSLTATGQLVSVVNGVTTTHANFIGGPISASGIEQIVVQGLGGDDSLTVDSVNGAISIPITYHGGENFDTLVLTGAWRPRRSIRSVLKSVMVRAPL